MHTKTRTSVSVLVGSLAVVASLVACSPGTPASSGGTTTQTPPRPVAAAVCPGDRPEAADPKAEPAASPADPPEAADLAVEAAASRMWDV